MRTIEQKLDILIEQVALLTINLSKAEEKISALEKLVGSQDDWNGVIRILEKKE